MTLEEGRSIGFSVDGGGKEGVIYDHSQAPLTAELVFLVWSGMDTITSILAPSDPNFYLMATTSSIAIKVSPINLTIQT